MKLESTVATVPAPQYLTRVCLHQSVSLPAGGGMESSLYLNKGVKMIYSAEGIISEYKGSKFIIPLANVIVAYLA